MSEFLYNGSEIAAPFSVESYRNTQRSRSLGLRTTTRVYGPHQWQVRFMCRPGGSTDAVAAWMRGREADRDGGTMEMPQLPHIPRNATTYTVETAESAGADSVQIRTQDPIETLRFVGFTAPEHTKIYRVEEIFDPVTLTGNVPAQRVRLFPALVAPVARGAVFTLAPTFRYVPDGSPNVSIVYQDGILPSEHSVSLVEQLGD